MSEILFEQYKDALRRGHVAALRGKLEAAVSAYEAAASIAPDRALPYVSLGEVLRRLGRAAQAEAAFAAALQRAPSDERALRGRAELRIEQGSTLGAAQDLEALAEFLERDGRMAAACDAARQALELAESRSRRRTVERLVGRLRELETDPAAIETLGQALRLLEPADPPSRASSVPATPPPPPPIDPVIALREAERHLDAGEFAAARPVLLAISAAERAAGQLDAALDACLILLTINPSDPAVQLEIAAIQVARGWTATAAEKVRLLSRLAALDEDPEASAAIVAFSREHRLAPDEPTAGPATGSAG